MCRGFNWSVLYVCFTSSIYSNVGHVGQSTVSSNIIVKGDHTARFAFIWLNDFIGYLSMYFCEDKTKFAYSVKKIPILIQYTLNKKEMYRVMVFNATFNNISPISWRSVLIGLPQLNHHATERGSISQH
jgi:hypothetical protein